MTTQITQSRLALIITSFYRTSAAQSSAQTHIDSAIVAIDTSNNSWHSQVHWLVGMPYLAIKASDGRYVLSMVPHACRNWSVANNVVVLQSSTWQVRVERSMLDLQSYGLGSIPIGGN